MGTAVDIFIASMFRQLIHSVERLVLVNLPYSVSVGPVWIAISYPFFSPYENFYWKGNWKLQHNVAQKDLAPCALDLLWCTLAGNYIIFNVVFICTPCMNSLTDCAAFIREPILRGSVPWNIGSVNLSTVSLYRRIPRWNLPLDTLGRCCVTTLYCTVLLMQSLTVIHVETEAISKQRWGAMVPQRCTIRIRSS